MSSKRAAFPRSPNAWTRLRRELEANGSRLWDWTVSNPTQTGFAPDARRLAALSQERAAIYTPDALGKRETRLAVARAIHAIGGAADSDALLLAASTSEAYGYLFKWLADPGDRLLAPLPSYPLLDHLAQLEGAILDRYRLRYDGAWHVDASSVERAIRPNTRAIVIVSPNNPTGHYVSDDDWRALSAFGLPIIVDEVFAPFPLAQIGREPRSRAGSTETLVFALGGLSKWMGLPQMKLGWCAVSGPSDRVEAAMHGLEFIADTFLSVSGPIELAAADWLGEMSHAQARISARAAENLDCIRSALAGSSATLLRAEGGWTACIQLPNTRTEDEVVTELATRYGVLVHPGAFYEFEQGSVIVVSLIAPLETTERGTRALRELARDFF